MPDAPLTTPAMREAYRETGFLVFDPGIPAAVLDGAVAELRPRWDTSPSRPDLLNAHRIRNAWHWSENVRRIAIWPRVIEVLRALYGREPIAFQTLDFLVGTQQPAHADTIHFNTDPPGYVCGVWVALEDMGEDNGPLVYYPGSHAWPEYGMEDVGVASSKRRYPDYEEFIARRIAESGIAPRLGLVKKGQAILWHGNLAHGGAPRKDAMRTRLSQVTHFIHQGTRLYTPLRSRGGQRFVRNPRPVRAHEGVGDLVRWGFSFLAPGYLASFLTGNLPHLVRSELLRRE